ncbi:MAG: sulfurtransferase [Candidatus Competibacteraceae bacterium]|jgi:thiosulfate/3-mercaptopyruvate sulfurtransferase|nr:sulfurtransferase [Candidatus Competibacteraceae bacterium]
MLYHTLITPTVLYEQLNQPDWVIVDCRFSLQDTEAGRRAYQEGHIPGAHYAHLDEDLSSPITPTSGRHPLTSPSVLAKTFARWGISSASQVVAYDDAGGSIASRLWWLLGWLGHHQRAVLDGGLPAWRRAGLPMSADKPDPQSAYFQAQPDDSRWVDSDTLLTTLVHGDKSTPLLVDARAAIRFRGEQEPIDPVAGHIPKAVNLPLEGNLDTDGGFLPAKILQDRYTKAMQGHDPAQVIHMCGSGVTACHNLLAMEVAGLNGSRLYAGSWSEWIRDPSRPIATGDS